ncbi:hypothetical protein C8F01DRAFT_635224 [Mycena amicta]|nr:hypothetical protein C8F01DRAFT_635224 [Mycena amicta]
MPPAYSSSANTISRSSSSAADGQARRLRAWMYETVSGMCYRAGERRQRDAIPSTGSEVGPRYRLEVVKSDMEDLNLRDGASHLGTCAGAAARASGARIRLRLASGKDGLAGDDLDEKSAREWYLFPSPPFLLSFQSPPPSTTASSSPSSPSIVHTPPNPSIPPPFRLLFVLSQSPPSSLFGVHIHIRFLCCIPPYQPYCSVRSVDISLPPTSCPCSRATVSPCPIWYTYRFPIPSSLSAPYTFLPRYSLPLSPLRLWSLPVNPSSPHRNIRATTTKPSVT